MLASSIHGAVEVSGSDKPEVKESRIIGFTNGGHRVLVTKPKIAGFGMNWQHCRNMIFVGLSDSWEQYYQAIRRCWRYGQTETVNVYVVTADIEGMVVENIKRKDEQSDRMMDEMAAIAKDFFNDYTKASNELRAYQPKKTAPLPNFI
jgi:SNF2 family DNA or RNA helicase